MLFCVILIFVVVVVVIPIVVNILCSILLRAHRLHVFVCCCSFGCCDYYCCCYLVDPNKTIRVCVCVVVVHRMLLAVVCLCGYECVCVCLFVHYWCYVITFHCIALRMLSVTWDIMLLAATAAGDRVGTVSQGVIVVASAAALSIVHFEKK